VKRKVSINYSISRSESYSKLTESVIFQTTEWLKQQNLQVSEQCSKQSSQP